MSPLRSSSKSSMFLSARSIAARRLAFSLARDSAHARKSETNRYSRMSARRVAVPPPMTSGTTSRRPGTFGQPASPAFVQRQQSLADGLVHRPGRGAVVEEVELGDFTLAVARLALDENLPDQRGDGLDGVRHGEEPHQRQARVRQARVHALTDGPDSDSSGQRGERLHRIVGHHLVELAHQSLVGTEHDGADRARSVAGPFGSTVTGDAVVLPESTRPTPAPRSDSSRPSARTDFSYCPMLEAAKAFIVRTTDWRSPALLIFRRRLAVVSLMASPSATPWAWIQASTRPAWSPAWVQASAGNGRALGGRCR